MDSNLFLSILFIFVPMFFFVALFILIPASWAKDNNPLATGNEPSKIIGAVLFLISLLVIMVLFAHNINALINLGLI